MQSLIALGKVREFSEKHGYYYSVRGIVRKGDARGKLLGFPTANIKVSADQMPLRGVYAVKVKIDDVIYKGVANIGYAPTFGRNEFMAEVHIFDFSADLYGQELGILFVDFIREEKKFDSADELVEQIREDCNNAREILKSVKAE
ncbi:MAG: riboflavin kinase [Candidatus Aenigmarchaeota archaeon]|nr:riboflavin kinase [Candidatus Aenigmarchaeota archaeon]